MKTICTYKDRQSEDPWSSFSKEKDVKFFDEIKTVHVASIPLDKVKAIHENLETEIEVPSGMEVYYGVRSNTLLQPGTNPKTTILGSFIGLVKDGVVVEERFLDILHNNIAGIRT